MTTALKLLIWRGALAVVLCGASSYCSKKSGDKPAPGPGTDGGEGSGTGMGGQPAANQTPFVHPLFGDHMVLPRTAAAVYGWAASGATVMVQIPELGVSVSAAAAANGQWRAVLGDLAAGGPYTVQISGPQSITLQDVLVGEVWLSAGQSNAALALNDIINDATTYDSFWRTNASEELANSANGNIRLLEVQWDEEPAPEQVFAGGVWQACSPTTVGSFAAEAYFFAKYLQQTLNVPVGVIEASLGGTYIRQWLSQDALNGVAGLQAFNGVTSATLYNGTVAPFAKAPISGAVWYQGEADATDSPDEPLYANLLSALVSSWRQLVGNDSLPFLIVQIANYGPPQSAPVETDGYDAAGIREAQLEAVQGLSNTALIVTIDIGDGNTVHPPNKWDVGARLATAAAGLEAGAATDYSAPLYDHINVEGSQVTVSFDHADNGLMIGTKENLSPVVFDSGASLQSFAIADSSGNWVSATATIQGNTVIVSAPSVGSPVAVRYGWAANPSCNLYGSNGMPASPFRSDTQPPD